MNICIFLEIVLEGWGLCLGVGGSLEDLSEKRPTNIITTMMVIAAAIIVNRHPPLFFFFVFAITGAKASLS